MDTAITILLLGFLLQGGAMGQDLDSFDLYFDEKNDTGYVNLSSIVVPDLDKFTVCFWFLTNETETTMTVLSYVGKGESNEVHIHLSSTAVSMVLGSSEREVEASVRDGEWHNICSLWSADGGNWELRIDGATAASGDGLKPDSSLLGGGNLLIGQRQSGADGSIVPDLGFVGLLTDLNIYAARLNAGTLDEMSGKCINSGDVLAWKQVQNGELGDGVLIENPTCVEDSPDATTSSASTVAPQRAETTIEPTNAPTIEPTNAPTIEPTNAPTIEPTNAPTIEPTNAPTIEPTNAPTIEPTNAPTIEPTNHPTIEPTNAPIETFVTPSKAPTVEPTKAPIDTHYFLFPRNRPTATTTTTTEQPHLRVRYYHQRYPSHTTTSTTTNYPRHHYRYNHPHRTTTTTRPIFYYHGRRPKTTTTHQPNPYHYRNHHTTTTSQPNHYHYRNRRTTTTSRPNYYHYRNRRTTTTSRPNNYYYRNHHTTTTTEAPHHNHNYYRHNPTTTTKPTRRYYNHYNYRTTTTKPSYQHVYGYHGRQRSRRYHLTNTITNN